MEILKQNGKHLILVPNSVIGKVGEQITTFRDVFEDYKNSFQYDFVDVSELSDKEIEVFSLAEDIKQLFRKRGYDADIPVVISESICVDDSGYETNGIYESDSH